MSSNFRREADLGLNLDATGLFLLSLAFAWSVSVLNTCCLSSVFVNRLPSFLCGGRVISADTESNKRLTKNNDSVVGRPLTLIWKALCAYRHNHDKQPKYETYLTENTIQQSQTKTLHYNNYVSTLIHNRYVSGV